MFVWRDFVSTYKQTILGPLWFILQPLLTTIIFVFVFGNFAGLSTDGLPKFLFYLAGVTIWNYFSECFNRTSNVFTANAGLYGKVYFPRLIIPLSIITANLVKFFIQFILFLFVLFYFKMNSGMVSGPNAYVLLTPVLLIMMAGFALGGGLLISAMTNKYRDLVQLISFGIQLLMYVTPVIYPVNSLSAQHQKLALLNPLAHVIEAFRFSWTGTGYFSWEGLLYSSICMIVLVITGIILFNKVESTFLDNV
ncbi:MAG TPA: ABC transporter permease [Chitinophagaceae bacterium]|nr:ABC transporter permease [Chitinophagaceae bacterium]